MAFADSISKPFGHWVRADLDPKWLTLRETGPRRAVDNAACLTTDACLTADPGMCIFVISRFQTTFSHEMTVVSEIYCQNLKDKTSISSLGQIIKMCYFRIHAHVHA